MDTARNSLAGALPEEEVMFNRKLVYWDAIDAVTVHGKSDHPVWLYRF